MKRWAFVVIPVGALMALAFACGQSSGKETDCANGIDDDQNGASDCLDPACSSTSVCTGADGGVGQACDRQETCVVDTWLNDRPLMQCRNHTCTNVGAAVAVKFQANTTAFSGLPQTFKSMATRFISKTAVDGTAVTCDVLKGAADGGTAEFADQLEKSGRFNELAFDVISVGNGQGGYPVLNPFMYTATGSDFIIWNELWSQSPNPDTRMPQGTRLGRGCFETGAAVAPITLADNCPIGDAGVVDGGSCRTITVNMPDPTY